MSISTTFANMIHHTHQKNPIPGKQMVQNNGGGFSFKVDDMVKLHRYIIIGSENGTYYTSPIVNTSENIDSLLSLFNSGRGVEAVELIKNISINGRSPKQTPTLTALAFCAILGDTKTKQAANEALLDVCRIPTHLFEWLDLCEKVAKSSNGSTGWGRAHKRAVSNWYNNYRGGSPMELAKSITKYMQRGGWSHVDALRLSHAKPSTDAHKVVFTYIAKGFDIAKGKGDCDTCTEVLEYLQSVEEMKSLTKVHESRAIELIHQYGLVREHIPSPLLKSISIWESLLEGMPMTALIRSLSKLTSIGVITNPPFNTKNTKMIVERLTNQVALHKARIHPMNILFAHRTYSSGHGDKGKLTWKPNGDIISALDRAFDLCFDNVEAANKRFLLALDVSGSMGWTFGGGSRLTCHEASAAMALVTMRTEPYCKAMCFSDSFNSLPIQKDSTLKEAISSTHGQRFGSTDCSLPMIYAMEKNMKIDVFVIYTDSETYYGDIHPCQALMKYRKYSGIQDAKLIVVAMASNGFTIADPDDAGMLDVVGFDSSTPTVMSSFAAEGF